MYSIHTQIINFINATSKYMHIVATLLVDIAFILRKWKKSLNSRENLSWTRTNFFFFLHSPFGSENWSWIFILFIKEEATTDDNQTHIILASFSYAHLFKCFIAKHFIIDIYLHRISSKRSAHRHFMCIEIYACIHIHHIEYFFNIYIYLYA